MEEKKHEYQICFISEACYFKCYICGEFLVLDKPETYEEAEEQKANLAKQHKH